MAVAHDLGPPRAVLPTLFLQRWHTLLRSSRTRTHICKLMKGCAAVPQRPQRAARRTCSTGVLRHRSQPALNLFLHYARRPRRSPAARRRLDLLRLLLQHLRLDRAQLLREYAGVRGATSQRGCGPDGPTPNLPDRNGIRARIWVRRGAGNQRSGGPKSTRKPGAPEVETRKPGRWFPQVQISIIGDAQ